MKTFLLLLLTATLATAATNVFNVTLAWDPNTEADLAGYNLYYGTVSGQYTTRTNVGKVTTFTVKVTNSAPKYYFAVTAYNTSGLESDPSNEAVYSPPMPPIPPKNLRIAATLQASSSVTGPWTNVASILIEPQSIEPSAFYRSFVSITPSPP